MRSYQTTGFAALAEYVESVGRKIGASGVATIVSRDGETLLERYAGTPGDKPHHGFFWWINDNHSPLSELGAELPATSFQVLGASGCVCLVIPERKVVAVRMYNRLGGAQDYDYLSDVQAFGNRVLDCVTR